MTMKMHQAGIILTALIAVSVGVFPQAANAGGVCGKCAPIRGSVGKWCDDKVEKPITTPYARKTTVGVTTAVGTAVGGAFGGQYGAMGGGYAGQYVGNTVNERLAGQSPPIGRPYHYQQTQPFEPPPEQAYQEQGQSGFTDQPPPVAYPPSQYQPPQYQ